MKNSWKHFLLTNILAALASCAASVIIITVSYYYSFGLSCLILGPINGGFLATCLVLYLIEESDELHLVLNSWQTLLLGTSVALMVTVGFICAISQHFLFLPTVHP